jgi:hypothetical protein
MKRSILFVATLIVFCFCATLARADVAAYLEAATKAGHPVFLIVTEGEGKLTDLARKVSTEAAKLANDAGVVELERGDPANAAVVKRLRLESAPLPLILVIASNGVAAGAALPNAITAPRLAKMVPSPAKAAFLKAIDEGKPAFIMFAAEETPGRRDALSACEAARKQLGGKAASVVVDLADARESGFREELKVPANLKAPFTVVFNAKGLRVATFETLPAAPALVEASKKTAAESSCCPGGTCK